MSFTKAIYNACTLYINIMVLLDRSFANQYKSFIK